MKKRISLWLLLIAGGSVVADVIVVDKAGGGRFTTIQEAISEAQFGDTIDVRRGIYEEAVVISKGLTLKGAGPQFVMIKAPTEAPAIRLPAGGTVPKFVFIQGLTILAPSHHAVSIETAQTVHIVNCVIAQSRYGIVVEGPGANCSARVFVKNCTIASTALNGFYAYDAGADEGYFEVVNSIFYECGLQDSTVFYHGFRSGVADYIVKQGLQPLGIIAGNFKDIDVRMVAPAFGNYVLQTNSPGINAGWPGPGDVDPDGSRTDLGAFGGPGAAAFWPYPVRGPVVTTLVSTTSAVVQGQKITIKAQATTR